MTFATKHATSNIRELFAWHRVYLVGGLMKGNADPYDFLVRPAHMPRGSLANHVTDQFRAAIVSLKLEPGTVLKKNEICARLGISRSPVSEAMARLQAEGLVEILPQRGTVVSLVSLRDVEESIFVRKGLECETVRMLAEAPSDGLVAALAENLVEQRDALAAEDIPHFHKLDLAFHGLMIGAIGYGRMQRMAESARNNLSRARHLTNSLSRMAKSISDHEQVFQALVDGDGDRAAHAMRKHLEDVLRQIHQVAHSHPHLFDDGIIALKAIGRLEPQDAAG